MKQQRKKTVGNRLLVSVWRYVTFFSVMAFSITGCMILFLRITERELGLIYTEDKISHAAVLTFINIVLLSMFFTIFRWNPAQIYSRTSCGEDHQRR